MAPPNVCQNSGIPPPHFHTLPVVTDPAQDDGVFTDLRQPGKGVRLADPAESRSWKMCSWRPPW